MLLNIIVSTEAANDMGKVAFRPSTVITHGYLDYLIIAE